MELELIDEPVELGLVAFDLDSGRARVGVGAADLDVDQVVGDAGLDDGVEHLGQEERVDDVAGQLDGLVRHGVCLLEGRWASTSARPHG